MRTLTLDPMGGSSSAGGAALTSDCGSVFTAAPSDPPARNRESALRVTRAEEPSAACPASVTESGPSETCCWAAAAGWGAGVAARERLRKATAGVAVGAVPD